MTLLSQTYRLGLAKLGLRRFILRIHADLLEKGLLGFEPGTYLLDHGWHLSRKENQCLDRKGDPIPWMTYPFLDYIQPKLSKNLHVFEFGSGNSTLFWAHRTAEVTAVEHDEAWFSTMMSRLPENAKLTHVQLDDTGAYSTSCSRLKQKYELVVVDGRDRVNCILHAVDSLTDDGVLVLDNSDRAEYLAGRQFMAQHGFKHLDFWGMAPLVTINCCTTIFYRDTNWLNL